jgi:hypothetical protein
VVFWWRAGRFLRDFYTGFENPKKEPLVEQADAQKRPSLTEVVPALHAWLAKQEGRSFGIFHAIIIRKLYDQCLADAALQQAKASGDRQTIDLAEMLVALSSMQRRKLSSIWHFYDPASKVVKASKSVKKPLDFSRRA